MNHYPHHIGDFLRKTAGLSEVEECVYRRLMDWYYAEESSLPGDRGECYRAARITSAAGRKAVDYILGRYFELQADGWHNARCDQEIVAYRDKAAKARENGLHGGRPARNQSGNRVGNQSGSLSGTETKASQNQEPEPRENQGHKTKARKRAVPVPNAPLPEWIPAEQWTAFVAMRRDRGKPMSSYAEQLAVGKLGELRADGHAPKDVLEQSIFRGWTGLFPIKADYAAPVAAVAPAVSRMTRVGQQSAVELSRWMGEERGNGTNGP